MTKHRSTACRAPVKRQRLRRPMNLPRFEYADTACDSAMYQVFCSLDFRTCHGHNMNER